MLFFDTKELLCKIKVLPLLKETNFDMTKKRFMKLVTIDAAMSFQEMYVGSEKYTRFALKSIP